MTKTRIQKWGRSLAVRIPKAAAEEAGLTLGMEVEIQAKMEKVVICKQQKKTYTLKELLKGVTPRNIHAEVDFGPPVGRELL